MVYTAFASGTPTTTGTTWTNTTNATGTNNAAFATLTNATSASSSTITLVSFATNGISGIASDTINSVGATVWQNVATTSRWTSVTATLLDSGGSAIGSAVALTLSTTSAHSDVITFTTTPTAAQVAAGLQIKLTAVKSGSTSSTFNVDAVQISVDYSLTNTQYVSSASAAVDIAAQTTAGTVTVSAPASIVTGNLLVAFVGDSTGLATSEVDTPTAPSGWTLQAQYDNTNDAHIALWTKTATGAEPGTYTFGLDKGGVSAGYDLTVGVLQYTGVQLDQIAHNSSANTATNSPVAPSITTTVDNGTYIAAWVQRIGNGAITPPATMSSRQQKATGGLYSFEVADAAYSTHGVSGTWTATSAGTSDRYQALTVSLIPQSSNFSDNATLSGVGSLSAVAIPNLTAGAALSGAGSLSAQLLAAITKAVTLSGVGVLSTVGGPAAAAGLSGVGTLSTVRVPALAAAAGLAGAGSLSAAIVPQFATPAALAGVGSLTAAVVPSIAVTTGLSGVGTLTTVTTGPSATASLSGVGVLSAAIAFGTLVFSDDFPGTTLDTTKWSPTWFGATGYQDTTVLAANVSIASSVVTLQVDGSGSGSILTTNPHNGDVSPGFEFGYGYYVEARIWFPASNWAAFWTDGQNWPTDGEADIVEGSTDGSGGISSNYHSPSNDNNFSVSPSTSWTGGWHTYALRRLPGVNEIYWDGALIRSYSTFDAGAAQYLILDNRRPDPLTNAFVSGGSGAMLVDYVKVWQLPIRTAPLSGVGSLSVVAKPVLSALAGMSGAGALSATRVPQVAIPAGLSGTGALSVSAAPGLAAAATLTGTGSLSAATALAITGQTASLSGVGSLTASTVPKLSTTAALGGTGTLGTGSNFVATAGLSGAGALAVTQVPAVAASAALAGVGALSAAIAPGAVAAAALSGLGVLTVTTKPGAATGGGLSGSGVLSTAVALPILATFAALAGTGALSAVPIIHTIVAAVLSGLGVLDAGTPIVGSTARDITITVAGFTGHLGRASFSNAVPTLTLLGGHPDTMEATI